MDDRAVRVMNGRFVIEDSPSHHGCAWLSFDRDMTTPDLTPRQLRNLALALRQAADELEGDES